MTTPPAIPASGTSPADHAATLTTIIGCLADDAARFGLRPIDLSVHLDPAIDLRSAAVQLPGGDTAAVDTIAGAYGLDPADGGTDLYQRAGDVVLDGQQVHVAVFCGVPAPAPEAPAALPAATDAPAAVAA